MTLSSTTKQGFTTYQLKILAVVTMTLDHIYSYLGGSLPIPFWFGLLGRLAAPLFLFCVAKGVYYTHDRAAYCRRLYIAAVLMGLGNWLVNHYLTIPHGVTIENHIFSTLFYTVYFLSVLEWLRDRRKDRDTPLQAAALLVLPFLFAEVSYGFWLGSESITPWKNVSLLPSSTLRSAGCSLPEKFPMVLL